MIAVVLEIDFSSFVYLFLFFLVYKRPREFRRKKRRWTTFSPLTWRSLCVSVVDLFRSIGERLDGKPQKRRS
jgi:hypothetical protein